MMVPTRLAVDDSDEAFVEKMDTRQKAGETP